MEKVRKASLKLNGMTIVELLVALMALSIVFAAIATLSHSLGTTHDALVDISRSQVQVRSAMVRLSELIRNCRLVCAKIDGRMSLWRADDDSDGKIDIDELVFIDTGRDADYLRLVEFTPTAGNEGTFYDLVTLRGGTVLDTLKGSCEMTSTLLIPHCTAANLITDEEPPWTRTIDISFDLTEHGSFRNYQIKAYLRSWAGHLIGEDECLVTVDDD